MHSRKLIAAAVALMVAGIACNGPRRRAEKPGTNSERGRDAAGDSALGIGTGGFSGPGGGGSGGTLDADGPNMDTSDPEGRPPRSDAPSSMDAAPAPDGGDGDIDLTTGPVCGNGVAESGEECDPPGSCPTGCPNQGCTRFALQGEASRCTARCVEVSPQVACQGGDGCCPPTCNATNDGDCAIKCDNGVKEGQETCDPLSSCPSACPPSGCQLRKLVNPGTCGAACVNDRQQTTCASGDGCCPSTCNATNDGECPARCGNGVVENGETCDPTSQCNSRRDACTSNRDTVRTRAGDASSCTFRCMEAPRACGPDDSQCPSGCGPGQDPDCKRPNGETCEGGGECVSGNCVGSVCCDGACNDGCRSCRVSGRVGTCSPPSSEDICTDQTDNNCNGRINEDCLGLLLSPVHVGFGRVAPGTRSEAARFNLRNTGKVALETAGGLSHETPLNGCGFDFEPMSVPNQCGDTIQPGEDCFLAAVFASCLPTAPSGQRNLGAYVVRGCFADCQNHNFISVSASLEFSVP